MNGILAACPVHGTFLETGIIGVHPGVVANITFKNSYTTCPRCDRTSPIINGTYEFIGELLRAFSPPSVTRDDIVAFMEIAQAAGDGRMSIAEATEKSAEINPDFAGLWQWIKTNSGALSLLASLLGLILTYLAIESSDSGSTQQHEDAQRQLSATQSETQVQRSEQQAQQKIYELLVQQCSHDSSHGSRAQPTSGTQQAYPPQTPASGTASRQQRRRAQQLAKKRPRHSM